MSTGLSSAGLTSIPALRQFRTKDTIQTALTEKESFLDMLTGIEDRLAGKSVRVDDKPQDSRLAASNGLEKHQYGNSQVNQHPVAYDDERPPPPIQYRDTRSAAPYQEERLPPPPTIYRETRLPPAPYESNSSSSAFHQLPLTPHVPALIRDSRVQASYGEARETLTSQNRTPATRDSRIMARPYEDERPPPQARESVSQTISYGNQSQHYSSNPPVSFPSNERRAHPSIRPAVVAQQLPLAVPHQGWGHQITKMLAPPPAPRRWPPLQDGSHPRRPTAGQPRHFNRGPQNNNGRFRGTPYPRGQPRGPQMSRSRKPIPAALMKDSMCPHFSKGKCTWGESCRFSHGLGGRRNHPMHNAMPVRQNPVKRILCIDFQKNLCNRSSCRYLHERGDISWRPITNNDEEKALPMRQEKSISRIPGKFVAKVPEKFTSKGSEKSFPTGPEKRAQIKPEKSVHMSPKKKLPVKKEEEKHIESTSFEEKSIPSTSDTKPIPTTVEKQPIPSTVEKPSIASTVKKQPIANPRTLEKQPISTPLASEKQPIPSPSTSEKPKPLLIHPLKKPETLKRNALGNSDKSKPKPVEVEQQQKPAPTKQWKKLWPNTQQQKPEPTPRQQSPVPATLQQKSERTTRQQKPGPCAEQPKPKPIKDQQNICSMKKPTEPPVKKLKSSTQKPTPTYWKAKPKSKSTHDKPNPGEQRSKNNTVGKAVIRNVIGGIGFPPNLRPREPKVSLKRKWQESPAGNPLTKVAVKKAPQAAVPSKQAKIASKGTKEKQSEIKKVVTKLWPAKRPRKESINVPHRKRTRMGDMNKPPYVPAGSKSTTRGAKASHTKPRNVMAVSTSKINAAKSVYKSPLASATVISRSTGVEKPPHEPASAKRNTTVDKSNSFKRKLEQSNVKTTVVKKVKQAQEKSIATKLNKEITSTAIKDGEKKTQSQTSKTILSSSLDSKEKLETASLTTNKETISSTYAASKKIMSSSSTADKKVMTSTCSINKNMAPSSSMERKSEPAVTVGKKPTLVPRSKEKARLLSSTSKSSTQKPREQDMPEKVKNFDCKVCGVWFAKIKHLLKHRREIHLGKKPGSTGVAEKKTQPEAKQGTSGSDPKIAVKKMVMKPAYSGAAENNLKKGNKFCHFCKKSIMASQWGKHVTGKQHRIARLAKEKGINTNWARKAADDAEYLPVAKRVKESVFTSLLRRGPVKGVNTITDNLKGQFSEANVLRALLEFATGGDKKARVQRNKTWWYAKGQHQLLRKRIKRDVRLYLQQKSGAATIAALQKEIGCDKLGQILNEMLQAKLLRKRGQGYYIQSKKQIRSCSTTGRNTMGRS